jgi:hypothetical protein
MSQDPPDDLVARGFQPSRSHSPAARALRTVSRTAAQHSRKNSGARSRKHVAFRAGPAVRAVVGQGHGPRTEWCPARGGRRKRPPPRFDSSIATATFLPGYCISYNFHPVLLVHAVGTISVDYHLFSPCFSFCFLEERGAQLSTAPGAVYIYAPGEPGSYHLPPSAASSFFLPSFLPLGRC